MKKKMNKSVKMALTLIPPLAHSPSPPFNAALSPALMISVTVPVYNEAEALPILAGERVSAVAAQLEQNRGN